jgi:hypothetical protein
LRPKAQLFGFSEDRGHGAVVDLHAVSLLQAADILREDVDAGAAAQLIAQGYPVVEMEGGFSTWEANAYPVVTSQPVAA